MSNVQALKIYQKTAVRSASPGQLILMLYDGALRFMDNALSSFEEPDFFKRNQALANSVNRAEAIIRELQAVLDKERGGEVAENFERLYDYMRRRLLEANANGTREPIELVHRLLKDVRDAWAEMLQNRAKETEGAQGLAKAA